MLYHESTTRINIVYITDVTNYLKMVKQDLKLNKKYSKNLDRLFSVVNDIQARTILTENDYYNQSKLIEWLYQGVEHYLTLYYHCREDNHIEFNSNIKNIFIESCDTLLETVADPETFTVNLLRILAVLGQEIEECKLLEKRLFN